MELMKQRVGRFLKPLRATPVAAWIMAAAWRREEDEWRGNAGDVASYHVARCSRAPATDLSDRVWSDLELEGVFARADRCSCGVGQQVLYDLMRRPLSDVAAIRRRDAAVRALSAQPHVVQEITAAVRGLRSPAAYELHRLVTGDLPDRPAWFPLLPLLSLTAAAALILMFVNPLPGLLLLLATIGCNVAVQVFYRPRVHHLVRPVAALPALLTAALRLSRLAAPELVGYTNGLASHCVRLRWIKWLSLQVKRESDADPITGIVAGYANLIFLADVNAFVFSLDLIRRHRADIHELIEMVGTLDALSAVSAFRAALPAWCTPELDGATTQIHAEGIYHPVVSQPVLNDFCVAEASLLITGSNMAGKTTYLRAAGVCAVLGQTIATCPAIRWRAPCLIVKTIINRKDDIQGGKSYFLVEAEYVRDLLHSAARRSPHIYIVDELYRGTNTHERIAAARAVLEHLNVANHICLVSTHDVELIELLRGGWEYWHFEESMNEAGMHFDYRIRRGAAAAGNALKVLELSGYPASVMKTAYATLDRLSGAAEMGRRAPDIAAD